MNLTINGEKWTSPCTQRQLWPLLLYLADLYNSQVTDSLQVEFTKDPASNLDPGKRWEERPFEDCVGNLAILEALKLDIFRRQQSVLELLNTRLGVNIFVPDTVMPISAPISDRPAGLPLLRDSMSACPLVLSLLSFQVAMAASS